MFIYLEYYIHFFLGTSLKPGHEHKRWLERRRAKAWPSVFPSAQQRPKADQYWVKTPFSSDVPLRQVLSVRRRWEEHKRSSRDASLWQRPMVRGSVICKDRRMSSFCGPHTSVMPRNCAFSHGTLSRDENEMTAEKRTNRAAWVEEEKEPFADTARLVLQQYILCSHQAMEGMTLPVRMKEVLFSNKPYF